MDATETSPAASAAPLDFTVHFRTNRAQWSEWGARLGERGARSRILSEFVERELQKLRDQQRG